jgi:hypothetical protein
VPLEIEFEPEEGPGPSWPDEPGAPGPEQLGAPPPTWWRAPRLRVLLYAAFAVSGVVVTTAFTTGFAAGQTAQRDRHIVAVRAAANNPLVIDPVPTTSGQTTAQQLATPWAGAFDREVAVTVVNHGPDPVTVVGGTLIAAQISPAAAFPAGEVLVPGVERTLRTRAHIDCVDYPVHLSPTNTAAIAATAHLDLRTADGVRHTVTLPVDPFGATIDTDVCARIQSPEVLGRPLFGTEPAPDSFSATVPVVNRAPFPLRVNLNQETSNAWVARAGLIVTTGQSVIPADTDDGQIAFDVQVTDCELARRAAGDNLGFETLVFTDARLTLNDPLARQFDAAFAAGPAADAIAQVCRGQ